MLICHEQMKEQKNGRTWHRKRLTQRGEKKEEKIQNTRAVVSSSQENHKEIFLV